MSFFTSSYWGGGGAILFAHGLGATHGTHQYEAYHRWQIFCAQDRGATRVAQESLCGGHGMVCMEGLCRNLVSITARHRTAGSQR